MKITNNHIFAALVAIIVVLAAFIYFQGKRNAEQSDDLAAFKIAMQDSFRVTTNKLGQQVAEVPVADFATQKEFQAAVMALKANGLNIQSVVDKNTQSLILLAKRLEANIEGETKVVGFDTAKTAAGKDSAIKDRPVYAVDTANKWMSIKGTVGYNKYQLKASFTDSLEFRGQWVSQGIFKPQLLTGQVINKNPYTTTTQFKVLQVGKKPGKFWTYAAFAGGLGGGYYIGKHVIK